MSKTSTTTTTALPWIEKYRPKKLDDVSHQEEVVEALRNTLNSGNLPHLLFYGPPGTGKTSTILAVARDLYGPELMKTRVLELNASHERGIDVIREKVKSFAQLAVSKNDKIDGHPCPPFKIIILDEADSMTRDAQSALRRVMEDYSKVTRFCIICNYVSRIIEPITSRCSKFRYKSLNESSMLNRLQYICQEENIKVQDSVLKHLIEVSEGDMRRVINLLQTAYKLAGSTNELTDLEVSEVSGVIPKRIITELWTSIKTQNLAHVQQAIRMTMREGYPVNQILQTLLQYLLKEDESETGLGDIGLSQVAIRMAEAERRLVDGANEEAQLSDVMSVAFQAYAQKM